MVISGFMVLLQPKPMLTTEDHKDVHSLYCHQKAIEGPWAMLPPRAILMECLAVPPEVMAMSWSVLPSRVMSWSMILMQPGTVLMSVACVTTKGYEDVCGLSCT